ncbi:hypothetical protein EDB92DRAFT_2085163 [Lactarius akahatsu]|uniref:CS domain-containing protein n=1 Tax=Lactarius akahatsu TaxID=416441 RepID=A0AAD4LLF3_9AGAM|nr:hypothetical protein EDB92DRAFT_2085163 [Lactarius akahatsu]
MSRSSEYQSSTYSWHQSHDQATVLLLVPYSTNEGELHVIIEQNILVAGVRGQAPLIKGRLYGNIDKAGSMWQLEPRSSGLSLRDRTASTTSTTSTRSSYALVSEPEISSSFAASLASGPTSDTEDFPVSSPGLSSPVSSADERAAGFSTVARPRRRKQNKSRTGSPLQFAQSIASPLSSVESLHASGPGRLLTLHLEKSDSIIWPSLIVGPVSESLSPCPPSPLGLSSEAESAFNMDPTSLTLTALELFDIRKDHDSAFGYFLRFLTFYCRRAWLQAHLPSATMRLVSNYIPLHSLSDPLPAPSEAVTDQGRIAYYIQSLGGPPGVAQLYLEAGLLHLEGAASMLLASSYSPLSSIRLPSQSQYIADASEGGSTAAWKRDREAARRYFETARVLCPTLEVPVLPIEGESLDDDDEATELGLRMPSVDLRVSSEEDNQPRKRHAQKEAPVSKEVVDIPQRARRTDDLDGAWYLYVPGLVGAGTAILVVGVIGALSFSSWRRNHN